MSALVHRFDRDGFAVLDERLPDRLLAPLGELFRKGSPGTRFSLQIPDAVTEALAFPALAAALEAFEPGLGPVRVLTFSKQPGANWFVPWHRDAAVAVRGDAGAHGFVNPTVKDGIEHWEAPEWLLNRMVAVRIHVDPAGQDDGPLEVVPGSHVAGTSPTREPQRCTAAKGDIHLMRPLLMHRSRKAVRPDGRRTVQVEFAPRQALPAQLAWCLAA